MTLDKKTIWKIIGIITAAAIIFSIFRNFTEAVEFVKGIASIFLPFIVGAAIAFVVNVPMRAIEKNLFKKNNKLAKARRPIALVLTIFAILAIVSAVVILVVPQLGETFKTLGSKIPAFMAKAEEYIEGVFKDYPQIQSTLTGLSLSLIHI